MLYPICCHHSFRPCRRPSSNLLYRILERLIAREFSGSLSTPLDPEYDCDEKKPPGLDGHVQTGVTSPGIASEAIESTPIGPCGSRTEFATMKACKGTETSEYHTNPHCGSDRMLEADAVNIGGKGVMRGDSGISGSGASDTTLEMPNIFSDTDGPTVDLEEDSIAAADWLDVSQAMLDPIDNLDPASG